MITIKRFPCNYGGRIKHEYSCSDFWDKRLIINKNSLRDMIKYSWGVYTDLDKYNLTYKIINYVRSDNKLIPVSEKIIKTPKCMKKHLVKLKFTHEDTGNCRTYYKGSDKNIYCIMEEPLINGIKLKQAYICCSSGEPSHPVKNIEVINGNKNSKKI